MEGVKREVRYDLLLQWLILGIWSRLDREIGSTGQYNLLFLMCLIISGVELSTSSDTSSE